MMSKSPLPGWQPVATGATRTLCIVGHPTVQVKSPGVFNARFAALGIDAVMFSVDVAPSGIQSFIALLRAWENSPGCVVTVPHKQAVAAACDELSVRSRALGVVNVVRREQDGRLIGDMTDGLGFVQAARGHGVVLEGCRAAVIGCGGAGSAIAHALAEAGAKALQLTDPDVTRRKRLAALLREAFAGLEVREEVGDLGGLDIVANASPVGMNDDARLPFAADSLSPPTLVADVVTRPEMTPWLLEAKSRGCAIQTGLEMTQGQVREMAAHLGFDFSKVV